MKNLFNNTKLKMVLIIIIGFIFGVMISNNFFQSKSESVKEVSIFTDTLVLENQGEIDIYFVDDGKWVVISLDDLRYIVKKRKTGKATVSKLESLFERFETPEKVSVKPTFK